MCDSNTMNAGKIQNHRFMKLISNEGRLNPERRSNTSAGFRPTSVDLKLPHRPVADGFLGPGRPPTPAFAALLLLLLYDYFWLFFFHLQRIQSLKMFLTFANDSSSCDDALSVDLQKAWWCSPDWFPHKSDALSFNTEHPHGLQDQKHLNFFVITETEIHIFL